MLDLSKYQQNYDLDALNAVQSSGQFFRFLSLGHPTSRATMAGNVRLAQFYLSASEENQIIPLGTMSKNDLGPVGTVRVIVGPWRLYAVEFEGGQKVRDSYDPTSTTYQEILRAKKSNVRYPDKAFKVGVSHLMYVPADQFRFDEIPDTNYIEEARQEFSRGAVCIMNFMNSAAQHAPSNRIPLGSVVDIHSGKIVGTKNDWFGPDKIVVVKNTTVEEEVLKALASAADAINNTPEAEVVDPEELGTVVNR